MMQDTNPHTMTNITEIIEKAAKEYGDTGSFQEWLNLPQNKSMGFIEGDYSKTIRCFTAGASFATSDPSVLIELLGKFAEWVGDKWLYQHKDGSWWPYGSMEMFAQSTEVLISKYIQETIKPKEDERNGNS